MKIKQAKKKLKIDEFVWAKMKGHPAWPGKILIGYYKDPPYKKRPCHYVYFFGYHNHAWVPEDQIFKYVENVKKFSNTPAKRNKYFRHAVKYIHDQYWGLYRLKREPDSGCYLDTDDEKEIAEENRKLKQKAAVKLSARARNHSSYVSRVSSNSKLLQKKLAVVQSSLKEVLNLPMYSSILSSDIKLRQTPVVKLKKLTLSNSGLKNEANTSHGYRRLLNKPFKMTYKDTANQEDSSGLYRAYPPKLTEPPSYVTCSSCASSRSRIINEHLNKPEEIVIESSCLSQASTSASPTNILLGIKLPECISVIPIPNTELKSCESPPLEQAKKSNAENCTQTSDNMTTVKRTHGLPKVKPAQRVLHNATAELPYVTRENSYCSEWVHKHFPPT